MNYVYYYADAGNEVLEDRFDLTATTSVENGGHGRFGYRDVSEPGTGSPTG
ncbi:MAG: hypothetical protein ACLU4J_05435 [Butyricimonas paravirosa]